MAQQIGQTRSHLQPPWDGELRHPARWRLSICVESVVEEIEEREKEIDG